MFTNTICEQLDQPHKFSHFSIQTITSKIATPEPIDQEERSKLLEQLETLKNERIQDQKRREELVRKAKSLQERTREIRNNG